MLYVASLARQGWQSILFGSLACLCSAAIQAQAVMAAPVLSQQAIRAHAEFLSSDLLEGRATGSRGYELAAAYVAAQFRQYGLAPMGDNGYLQTVPLIEATVVLPGSSATLKRDNTIINFEFSKDYLPTANFFNANTSLTAPLAFAGYGIDAPELKYNDFADLDLQGRIAVILSGTPTTFSAQARSYYSWLDTKYAALVKQGAIGVIQIDSDDRSENQDASQWERAVAMSWVSEMRLVNADEQPEESFPELKLRFRFNQEAAAQLFSNNGKSFEQVIQAARNSEPQSFNLPGALTLAATTGLRRIDSNNVLAAIRGSDPRLQNEYVLVVANLDQLGRGAAVNGDNIYNGLQRNAVGVAMMLDMARSIAALPRPRRSILFAAVTAGEKGVQGLQYLLNAGPVATRNLVAGVVLDTPLPIARTTDVIAVGADQSSLGVSLLSIATQQQRSVVTADKQQYSVLSAALAPLTRASIPVVSLRGGMHSRNGMDVRSLQREWLKLHLNQPSDEQRNTPLDTAAARELASLNAALVMALADAVTRPTWYRSSLVHRKLSSK